MNILDFEILKDEPLAEEELENFIKANMDGFILRWMVDGNTQAYSDLTFNYLEAAYLGQKCVKYAERLNFELKRGIHHYPVAEFVLKPTDAGMLAATIYEFTIIMTGEDEDNAFSHMENMAQFEEDIHQIPLAFPELLDDYLANRIHGEYYQIVAEEEYSKDGDSNFLEEEFAKFPERQFGYWQVVGADPQNKFYSSTDAWIIPERTSLEKTLKEHSGIGEIKFEKAEFYTINQISYLISKGLVLHFPFDIFLKAKACGYAAILNPPALYKNDWMNTLFTFTRFPYLGKNIEGAANDKYHALLETEYSKNNSDDSIQRLAFFISEFGDQILVRDEYFNYIIWYGDQPNFNELLLLNQKLSDIFMTSASLAGIVTNITLPWAQLDDEKFEQLCVDILYYNPTFNPATIRKMGKSRSRDSGRDIEVWTHARPSYKAEKFIFQCKFMKAGSSLTATKVTDISDTVDQFGASGYGVMTNVVIDPTLYDKLDRLSANKNIKVDDYSVYKLERILARYPTLVYRYFDK